MSLAEATREAVREHPFLYDALRAGVCNYAAAARFLDVGDQDPVVAALRRYEADLESWHPPPGDARVTMQRGVGLGGADPLLSLGRVQVGEGGDGTAVLATGDVAAATLRTVLGRLEAGGVAVRAAAVLEDTLLVVVPNDQGPTALRLVEGAV